MHTENEINGAGNGLKVCLLVGSCITVVRLIDDNGQRGGSAGISGTH